MNLSDRLGQVGLPYPESKLNMEKQHSLFMHSISGRNPRENLRSAQTFLFFVTIYSYPKVHCRWTVLFYFSLFLSSIYFTPNPILNPITKSYICLFILSCVTFISCLNDFYVYVNLNCLVERCYTD